jgi:hypothetical protein
MTTKRSGEDFATKYERNLFVERTVRNRRSISISEVRASKMINRQCGGCGAPRYRPRARRRYPHRSDPPPLHQPSIRRSLRRGGPERGRSTADQATDRLAVTRVSQRGCRVRLDGNGHVNRPVHLDLLEMNIVVSAGGCTWRDPVGLPRLRLSGGSPQTKSSVAD